MKWLLILFALSLTTACVVVPDPHRGDPCWPDGCHRHWGP